MPQKYRNRTRIKKKNPFIFYSTCSSSSGTSIQRLISFSSNPRLIANRISFPFSSYSSCAWTLFFLGGQQSTKDSKIFLLINLIQITPCYVGWNLLHIESLRYFHLPPLGKTEFIIHKALQKRSSSMNFSDSSRSRIRAIVS